VDPILEDRSDAVRSVSFRVDEWVLRNQTP